MKACPGRLPGVNAHDHVSKCVNRTMEGYVVWRSSPHWDIVRKKHDVSLQAFEQEVTYRASKLIRSHTLLSLIGRRSKLIIARELQACVGDGWQWRRSTTMNNRPQRHHCHSLPSTLLDGACISLHADAVDQLRVFGHVVCRNQP